MTGSPGGSVAASTCPALLTTALFSARVASGAADNSVSIRSLSSALCSSDSRAGKSTGVGSSRTSPTTSSG